MRTINLGAAPDRVAPTSGVPIRIAPDELPAPAGSQAESAGADRICEMLTKFSESASKSPDEEDARSGIFWSYIRSHAERSGQGENAVANLIQARCPGLPMPAKPAGQKPQKPPKEEGFHGKTTLSFAEAKSLSELLEAVLAPLSPEEAAKEIAREECLRDIVKAGGFPIVERLQARLKAFIATKAAAATFEISHGELVVTGHAVECAEAIGRIKTVRTVATVGGVAAGGAGLLWLLGIL
jgi:hypothetical protein